MNGSKLSLISSFFLHLAVSFLQALWCRIKATHSVPCKDLVVHVVTAEQAFGWTDSNGSQGDSD